MDENRIFGVVCLVCCAQVASPRDNTISSTFSILVQDITKWINNGSGRVSESTKVFLKNLYASLQLTEHLSNDGIDDRAIVNFVCSLYKDHLKDIPSTKRNLYIHPKLYGKIVRAIEAICPSVDKILTCIDFLRMSDQNPGKEYLGCFVNILALIGGDHLELVCCVCIIIILPGSFSVF